MINFKQSRQRADAGSHHDERFFRRGLVAIGSLTKPWRGKTLAVATSLLRELCDFSSWRGMFMFVLTAAILLGAVVSATAQQPDSAITYSAPVPGETLDAIISPAIAISPTGSHVVFVAASAEGGRQLFIRPVREQKATPIPGTAGAENPVFSPDGKWIAFVAFGKKLQKVPVDGGTPVTLLEITQPRGLSWGSSDLLAITPALSSGVMGVSPAGGTPVPLSRLKADRSHRWPDILPDGKTVLYTVPTGDTGDEGQIVAEHVGTDQRRVLVELGTQPRYSAGHLLFAHAGTLLSAPFDPERLELTGKSEKVLDHLQVHTRTGAAHYSIAADGTQMAYLLDPGGQGRNTLVWVNRDGSTTPLAAPQRPYEHPRLSPDGTRIAFSTPDEKIFIYDIGRNEIRQLATNGRNEFPIWSPDGKRVAFLSNRSGSRNVWWIPADGSGPAEQLTFSKNVTEPSGWSSDGRLMLVVEQAPQTNRNILAVRFNRPLKPAPTTESVVETAVDESAARFSPDGHWLVYGSNESGASEIYVKTFPPSAERWKISMGGGSEPVWSPAGNEIFYRNGDKMMSVEVKTTKGFTASPSRLLFQGNYRHGVTFRPDYDVTKDGKRFLMVLGSERAPTASQITFVPDWTKQKSP